MSDLPPISPRTDAELDALLAEPPKWPKVVGILSIVFGSIALTCGGLGTVAMFFQEQLMNLSPQMGSDPPLPVVKPPMLLMAVSFVGLAVNMLLIVAGVMTVSRIPKGRTLHLVYAGLAIATVFVATYANMNFQAEQNERFAEYVEQNPDSMFAQQQKQMQGFQAAMQTAGSGAGLLIGLTWPIFCLLWFTLSTRGKADMKGAGLESAA